MEADSITKGGEGPFAAGAKLPHDISKAAVQSQNRNLRTEQPVSGTKLSSEDHRLMAALEA